MKAKFITTLCIILTACSASALPVVYPVFWSLAGTDPGDLAITGTITLDDAGFTPTVPVPNFLWLDFTAEVTGSTIDLPITFGLADVLFGDVVIDVLGAPVSITPLFISASELTREISIMWDGPGGGFDSIFADDPSTAGGGAIGEITDIEIGPALPAIPEPGTSLPLAALLALIGLRRLKRRS